MSDRSTLSDGSILRQLLSIDIDGLLAGGAVSYPQCSSPLAEPCALFPVCSALCFQALKPPCAGLALTALKGC